LYALLWVAVTVTIATLVPLLAWDALPGRFAARAHDAFGATPLAAVAIVCILQAIVRRVPWSERVKAFLLAAAFLFWAANQLWPDHPRATLFNDIAIALFVADVVVPWSRWGSNGLPVAGDAPIEGGAERSLSQG
jgi:hypothetical protein